MYFFAENEKHTCKHIIENKMSQLILVVVLDSPERLRYFRIVHMWIATFKHILFGVLDLISDTPPLLFDTEALEVSISFDGLPNGIDILFSS